MIEVMKKENICASFTTSITLATFLLVMVMYVDDNDIFVTSTHNDPIPDVIGRSQQSLTTWRQTLQVTGGVVRPIKCSWVLISFDWRDSEYYYKTIAQAPAELTLENERGDMEVVRRIEPHTSVKSLGVFLQTTGGDDDELEYMTTNITTWLDMINLSTLPYTINLRSLHTRIIKTLIYPLPTMCLTQEDCVALEAALYRKSLPKCGVSSKLMKHFACNLNCPGA